MYAAELNGSGALKAGPGTVTVLLGYLSSGCWGTVSVRSTRLLGDNKAAKKNSSAQRHKGYKQIIHQKKYK